jgi:putative transposase
VYYLPRRARKKSESGIYHIYFRGINRQSIFEDEKDSERFFKTLLNYQPTCGYTVYAYCLMGNHIHLLLKVGKEPIEQIMRRICGSYVYWYNVKYDRIGNLFQDRFSSEPVESDAYFLTVVRYIHQNPLKAGLVSDIGEYRWSSYREYVNINKRKMIDVSFTFNIFDNDTEKALSSFIQFNNQLTDDKCLDMEKRNRITDEEARNLIKEICKVSAATDLQKLDVLTRNKFLRKLKVEHNLSIRQIERVTGINRGIIQKA